MIVIRWYNVSIVYSEYIFIKYTPYKNTACVVNRRGRIVRNCDIVPVLNKMNTCMTPITSYRYQEEHLPVVVNFVLYITVFLYIIIYSSIRYTWSINLFNDNHRVVPIEHSNYMYYSRVVYQDRNYSLRLHIHVCKNSTFITTTVVPVRTRCCVLVLKFVG